MINYRNSFHQNYLDSRYLCHTPMISLYISYFSDIEIHLPYKTLHYLRKFKKLNHSHGNRRKVSITMLNSVTVFQLEIYETALRLLYNLPHPISSLPSPQSSCLSQRHSLGIHFQFRQVKNIEVLHL